MTEHIEFTHLHTHTPEGSLLDGFMRIEKAVNKIKSLGMDALGVSDHGTMAAHYKFNEICKREGIHPVFAMEGYLTWDKSFKKEDFEKVNIETDKEGNHIFAFMQKEDAAGSWMPISYFPTKKRQQEIERLAKSGYYPRLYEESFADPAMIPQKKTAYNKGMNALVKSYKDKGYELCIKADTSQRDFFEWFPWSGHLLLIAKNNEGYQNLLRLNNIANIEGFYGKPRFDYEDIKKYGKGIICTTACMGSPSSQLILRGKLKEAKEEIQKYVDAFDEVYLEIQPSRNPDQWIINNQLIEWSEELNLPLIATTDAHMVDKDEMQLHETLTNIGRGSGNYSEDESDISAYDSAYLMSQEEILENGVPRIALQNAYDLSHRCQVTFLDDIEVKYPEYDVPPGYTFDSYLEELAWNGLFDIFLKKDYIEDYNLYQERLNYELKIIKDKKLSAYFIIVWDYIKWAKEQGIYVAPGRGSGAGSLVTYALSITNLDPIKYGLLFERFLNPERNSLPDIDSDFSSHRRHEVIDYLINKYGQDHVASIGTYQTMTSKAILRDVAKVMGVDHRLVLEWNKNIPAPNGNVMPIGEAIEEIPIISEASEQYPQLFELANDLQSMPKSKGIHASGYQVAPDNLYSNLPLWRNKDDEIITQYEGTTLENLGYIKFDILSTKVLSIIEIAVDLIEERHGVKLDINEIEPEDKAAFKTIQDGNTYAIFQLSSPGMTSIFTQLNEVDFNSLIAGVALYRPGPMEHIPDYIARANGVREVTYSIPELKEILEPTFGIAIYQESIMQITQRLGGYSAGQADAFRKSIG